MKKLLLGTVAINLTFISALALAADPSGSDVADIGDLTTGKITAVISDDAEESGEGEESGEAADLNLINANTTGAITLDGGEDSGEGEESDEGEDSLGELPDDADTDNLEITVSDDG